MTAPVGDITRQVARTGCLQPGRLAPSRRGVAWCAAAACARPERSAAAGMSAPQSRLRLLVQGGAGEAAAAEGAGDSVAQGADVLRPLSPHLPYPDHPLLGAGAPRGSPGVRAQGLPQEALEAIR